MYYLYKFGINFIVFGFVVDLLYYGFVFLSLVVFVVVVIVFLILINFLVLMCGLLI